ncbi:MAG: HAMP domain-containing histidine kinase [Acidobacteriota bacterium]|nr:HAMP domain-containing histidine kinase [Acidobacteriota bacterium]
MAARASHDLNNALAVFSGHIYLLRESGEPVSEALDAMEKALDNAERLARNLAEVGALGVEDPELLDVNELVRSTIREIPEGRLEVSLDGALVPLVARPSDLSRAIGALVQNAREADGGSATILVSTDQNSSEVRIVVEDSGAGIPEVVRRRDFDPLFSTSGERGRGLGITIARLAVLMAGGRLSIEQRPGGGTRAVLALPRPALG